MSALAGFLWAACSAVVYTRVVAVAPATPFPTPPLTLSSSSSPPHSRPLNHPHRSSRRSPQLELLFLVPITADQMLYGSLVANVLLLFTRVPIGAAAHLGGMAVGWLAFKWQPKPGRPPLPAG